MASSKIKLLNNVWQRFSQKNFVRFFNIVFFFIKWLFRYSGLEFFYRKFHPSQNPQKLPTGFIWLIGLYIVLFVVANQRFENRIEIIEIRANSIFAQLAVPSAEKRALSRIPTVQNMPCPYKPNLLNPFSVLNSFLKDGKYEDVGVLLKKTVEDWKASLDSVNLREAVLRDADLREANLQGADLSKADLRRADLRKANLQDASLRKAFIWKANFRGTNLQRSDLSKADLQKADLHNANLRGANLQHTNLRDASLQRASLLGADLRNAFLPKADFQFTNLWGADLRRAFLRDANLRRAGFQNTNLQKANLQGADLRDASLQDADLHNANLRGANLQDADLGGVKGLTLEQLCKASTLYETKLGQALEAQVKQECPDLLKEPQTAKENTSGEKK